MVDTLSQNELLIRLMAFAGIFGLMAAFEIFAPRRGPKIGRSRRWPSNLRVVMLDTLFVRLLFPVTPAACRHGDMSAQCQVRALAADEDLFREGDPKDHVYRVEDGDHKKAEPHGSRRSLFLSLILSLWLSAISMGGVINSAAAEGLFDFFAGPSSLEKVEAGIASRYTDIGHMAPDDLGERLVRGEALLLVDVREEAEYKVSRLPGAIRAAPGISLSSLQSNIGTAAHGKTIVFYCSVGERSSRLAQRAKETLTADGANGVYNLRGGIFAWHNQERPLVNESGSTLYVHPSNAKWGRLLSRQSLARTEIP